MRISGSISVWLMDGLAGFKEEFLETYFPYYTIQYGHRVKRFLQKVLNVTVKHTLSPVNFSSFQERVIIFAKVAKPI